MTMVLMSGEDIKSNADNFLKKTLFRIKLERSGQLYIQENIPSSSSWILFSFGSCIHSYIYALLKSIWYLKKKGLEEIGEAV